MMRPTYISDANAIRCYVSGSFGSNCFPSDKEIDDMVETIQFMDHPAYGEDWGEFLLNLPDYYDLIRTEMDD